MNQLHQDFFRLLDSFSGCRFDIIIYHYYGKALSTTSLLCFPFCYVFPIFNYFHRYIANVSIFLDPCESVKCDVYKVCSRRTFTSYKCVCQQCSSKYNLVCGSNGWTYASECHLRKYSCNNELSLNVLSNGPCGEYPFIILSMHL